MSDEGRKKAVFCLLSSLIPHLFQIRVAEADFYPRIAITGTIGYAAGTPQLSPVGALVHLVPPANALEGSIGLTFQWNILNYGGILNNFRLQDARVAPDLRLMPPYCATL